ncbi:MAG: dihydrolipoyl dehydrogenase [Clostridia bacterium]|nr:dihydrolipoyl dehydrogenase [Clostridia bacterium]
MREFDLTIIGAGPGGYETALAAAGSMRVALVEKDELGGTCLNRGCIPTKSLLHTADLMRAIRGSRLFGIEAGEPVCDIPKMHERKDQVIAKLRDGIALRMKQKKVTVLKGTGTILDPRTVRIRGDEEEIIKTERILIATGSRPAMPPIPGILSPHVETSDTLLDKTDGLYRRLIIIGGGVIGAEFASVFAALGSEVTIVEALPRLLPNMDREISQSLKMLFVKRGIKVMCGTKVLDIREEGEGLRCLCAEGDKEALLRADGILVAVGRVPFTSGLFEEGFTVDIDRGRIVVDERYRTGCPGIWAIGDVTGGVMLAHAATAQGKCALSDMLGKAPNVQMIVPACVYTDPEIAAVGLTLEEAREKGLQADSRKYPMSANGKSLLSEQERGFIKVVYEKDSRRLLGAHLMCARASDLISEMTQALTRQATLDDLRRVIRPHPTFSEGITEAVTAD